MKSTTVRDIIQEKLPDYITADAAGKSAFITIIATVSGMHRRVVIRALNRERQRSRWKTPPRLGWPKMYTAEAETSLARIWEQYKYPGAERLHNVMAEAVRIF